MNYFQPPKGYKGDQFREEMQYRSQFYEYAEVKTQDRHLQHKKRACFLLPRMDE
jgi:hypothetical protein